MEAKRPAVMTGTILLRRHSLPLGHHLPHNLLLDQFNTSSPNLANPVNLGPADNLLTYG